jgi:hypothetical protein
MKWITNKKKGKEKKGRATSCLVSKVNQNLEGITPHPSATRQDLLPAATTNSSRGLVALDISVYSPHKESGA